MQETCAQGEDEDAAGRGDNLCSDSDDSDTGTAGAASSSSGGAAVRRPRLRHRPGRAMLAAEAAAAASGRLSGEERESLNRQAVADAFRCRPCIYKP